MRFILLLLYSSLLTAQVEPVLWKVEKDTIMEWSYFFGDEFNGDAVNESIWYPRYPWGGLLAEEGSYADPKMLSQSNGLLKLSADTTHEWRAFPKWILETGGATNGRVPIRNGNEVELRYLCSAVWSKQQFKYGYFEARCKSPSGRGLWPAFWLYGGSPNEEIDFMEMKGEKTKHFHVDVHCPNDCDKVKTGWFGIRKSWGAWIKTKDQITDEFVVYSGIWKPGEIKMYMNGQEVVTFKGDFNTQMNLIANLAIAQDGKAFGPGLDADTKLPNDYYVDYMRVWHPLNGFDENEKPTEAMEQRHFEQPIAHSKIAQRPIRAKKTKRFMRDKAMEKAHLGFVSMIPTDANELLFEKNGLFDVSPGIVLADFQKQILEKIDLNERQVYFSLRHLKKGIYYVRLQNGTHSDWVQLKI